MNDLGEFSKLPEDPAYWADLEARVLESARAASAAQAGVPAGQSWWRPLAAHAWALGGLAAAASVAALFLAPAPVEPVSSQTMYLGGVVSAPVVAGFIASPTPPDLAELIAPPAPEARDD